MLIHADGVVVGDDRALRDGAVVVSRGGEVLDVGEAATLLPKHAGLDKARVHGVVFPGLVNAHTHIELSALRGQVPGGKGFVAWVDGFVGHRSEVAEDDERAAIEEAVKDLEGFGTSAVGDVSNRLTSVRALHRSGIGGSVFHEVFGVDEAALRRSVAALGAMRDEAVGSWPTDDLAYAVAPHTLYTTHPRVVSEIVLHARHERAPSTLHLAEHAAERRALLAGDGPMVDWLMSRTRGAAAQFPWPKMGPIAFADSLGALGPHVLSVHVTDASEAELRLMRERNASVVLCPRSNLYIDLRLPPLTALLAAGLEPALGTDSLASNASLDVLAEARALQDRFPTVSAELLLRMATWNGACALRRQDLGRIAKGTRPGIVAVLGDLGEGDPCAFLLAHVKAKRSWVSRRLPGQGEEPMS
jgi:cytosine/adenosine deaminase-related metal-dependent hydrolase